MSVQNYVHGNLYSLLFMNIVFKYLPNIPFMTDLGFPSDFIFTLKLYYIVF